MECPNKQLEQTRRTAAAESQKDRLWTYSFCLVTAFFFVTAILLHHLPHSLWELILLRSFLVLLFLRLSLSKHMTEISFWCGPFEGLSEIVFGYVCRRRETTENL